MLKKQLQRIYELVGQLATEVSDIDLGWYLLLTCLMHQCPRELIDAIINVHRTGEGQRQTIMAVAAAVFPPESAAIRAIGTLKNKTDELVSGRNAAMHSIIAIATFIVPPRIHVSGTTKPSKLKPETLEKDLNKLLADAALLNSALGEFIDALDTSGQPGRALVCPELKAPLKSPLYQTRN